MTSPAAAGLRRVRPAADRRRRLESAAGRRRGWAGRRWAVPAGVVVVVGLGTAAAALGPHFAAVTAGSLPARTSQQLVAEVRNVATVPLSGTLRQSTDLGLPDLPAVAQPTALPAAQDALLATSLTARIWIGSAQRERVAVISDLSETDVVRNGRDLWLWDSSADTASHVVLGGGGGAATTVDPTRSVSGALLSGRVVTPGELATSLLTTVGPGTGVHTGPTGRVAGRSAYELVLAPTGGDSLVGRAVIDVDAVTDTVLRVRVYSAGDDGAAFTTEFTRISFETPKPALFTFVPPAGASVRTGSPGPAERVLGSGWTAVLRADLGTAEEPTSAPSALETLLASAVDVHGSYGNGRLLRTTLLNVLVLPDGRVFAGAVTPAILERRASS